MTPNANTAPNNTVDDNVTELQERERRKNNLVVFNMPEADSEDREERKLYDVESIAELLRELNIQSEVSRPVRLGPKTADQRYPRPLRVTVEKEEIKWSVLKNAKNLTRSGKEQLRTVYVKRDMTPKERDQEACLRKELQEKRRLEEESGGQNQWIIWKGKIVKRRQPKITGISNHQC